MRRCVVAIVIVFGLHCIVAVAWQAYRGFLGDVGSRIVDGREIADLPAVMLAGFSVGGGVLVVAAVLIALVTSRPLTQRTKVWLKRTAIGLGSLLVLLAALLALLIHAISQPIKTKLGGNWILSRTQSLVIDSGSPPSFLQRVRGRERVTVAERPSSIVYLGDDCVLFTVWALHEVRYQVKAACGDRRPIVVADTKDYLGRDDLQPDPARVNGKKIPWADIRQHAERGESFVQE